MPLLLVLILVLIAFGLLLVGFLSASVVWAWVSVLVSATAAVVLIVDTVQRRSAVRAGDDAPDPARMRDGAAESVTSVALRSGGAPSGPGPGSAATSVVPVAAPRPPQRREPPEAVTEVIPVVRPMAWTQAAASLPDAEQTVVMPAVQPSGSPSGPPGAARSGTPSKDASSPGVTAGPLSAAEGTQAVPAGGEAAPPPESTAVVPTVGPVVPEKAPDEPPPDESAPDVARPDPAPGGPVTLDESTPAGSAPSAPNGADRPDATSPATDGPPPAVTPAAGPTPPATSSAAADAPPPTAATGVAVGTAASDDTALAGAGRPAEDTRAIDRASDPDLPAGEDGMPPEEPRDPEAASLVAGLPDEVLVIDELPRYHVPGCRTLLDAPPIPLPVREAVELGFTPCGWCRPDRTLVGRHVPARS